MLWIHPIIQTLCMVLATYVLYMGIQRFRFAHLGNRKARFNWKRHVLLGKITHAIWLAGFGIGLFMAWFYWGSINMTEGHFIVGVLMVPVILASFISGIMLEKPKGKKTKLAMTHGSLNVVLYGMAVYQAVSSVWVIDLFLLL